MVRVYPFNAFASAEVGNKHVVHSAPNRFCKNQNQSYDRSVVDGDKDEIHDTKEFVSGQQEMQIPIVILSKRRGREKEQEWGSSANLCSEYGITYRNVKEFIDGGILE
eukprot:CAMPEP_0119047268 /NCGR_PEP_ID=MMETSP1177-20130426/52149_1 /TAXON_ID=2985 /ORGANISM="Ochromonas sp, Strain CCMP1899" /LENGTH=107 /DNA_ID=CAMNT_0007021637 /DNA_START=213 /DNA_END=533 /DNA_ORIENTATION=-